MLKKTKYQFWLLAVALLVLTIVSLLKPDAAENVARAFVLLFGVC